MRIILVFAIILVFGCSTTSGVVPIGDDTYIISRSEKGFNTTGSRVKAEAYKEAYQYCTEKEKKLMITKTTQKDMVPFTSDAQAEIEFKCLDAHDPELKK